MAVGACSTTPDATPARVRTATTPRPYGAAASLAPSAERIAALQGIDPVWIERTRVAFMYDGAVTYVRARTPGATGPSTRANTHPVRVVLGNRSGSRGADRDRDGLSDEAEVAIGSNPDAFDTDGDTLPDSFEIFGTGTLPTVADTDGDSIADGAEVRLDDPSTYADDDGDGFPNGQERAAFNTDPNSIDSDGDGFGDDLEYFFGTAMNDRTRPTVDGDSDGEPDDFERANGTDPASAQSDQSDADSDDVPDWLDPDAVMMARVPGHRAAVAANGIDCGVRSPTRASRSRRRAPVQFA